MLISDLYKKYPHHAEEIGILYGYFNESNVKILTQEILEATPVDVFEDFLGAIERKLKYDFCERSFKNALRIAKSDFPPDLWHSPEVENFYKTKDAFLKIFHTSEAIRKGETYYFGIDVPTWAQSKWRMIKYELFNTMQEDFAHNAIMLKANKSIIEIHYGNSTDAVVGRLKCDKYTYALS